MQDSDIQELQKETFVVINFLMVAIAIGLGYFMLVKTQFNNVYSIIWWLPSVLIILTCVFSYRLYKIDKFRVSTCVFIGGLILSVVSFLAWPAPEFAHREIYLLLPIIAMSGLLINPQAAGQTANFAALTTTGAMFITDGMSWATLFALLFPVIMMYAVAAVSWISSNHLTTTLQWAYNSQDRAQQRSRELFESQLELKKAYELLETVNIRLKQAEATAVQANKFKTRFITNLSHELRTPLSAIINFSFVLSRNQHGQVSEEQRDYLTRIQDAGELLLEIVNDLLDLAKIEAGEMDLFIEPIGLTELCTSVINTISGLLTEKQVELKLKISPDLPEVEADSTRVRQILLNLMGNAEKYTDEGSITLRATQMADNWVQVSVIDTGIGIKEEDFERIFEEFQQTEEAFTMRKVGTGLGLPISKKFTELLGGRLWVESEYGNGATFHFTLPIHSEFKTYSAVVAEPPDVTVVKEVLSV